MRENWKFHSADGLNDNWKTFLLDKLSEEEKYYNDLEGQKKKDKVMEFVVNTVTEKTENIWTLESIVKSAKAEISKNDRREDDEFYEGD